MTPRSGGDRAAGGGREARRVVVFACGDPLRGDDSVAPVAVSALPREVAALAEVRIIGALETDELVDLPAGVGVVIVDAVVGPEPGAIVELSLAELGARSARVITTSTHQLPLDRVVALAQLLRDEPVMGRFVGMGIESVAEGTQLSEAVAGALPALRDAVARTIKGLAGPRFAPAAPAAPAARLADVRSSGGSGGPAG